MADCLDHEEAEEVDFQEEEVGRGRRGRCRQEAQETVSQTGMTRPPLTELASLTLFCSPEYESFIR